jgi:hypothetical protein
MAGGCVYFILRSQAYHYEIFWYVFIGELFLLFLVFKLPDRVIFSFLKIVILIIAFVGPVYISVLDPGYRPAIYGLFVLILALITVNSPVFFRSGLDKIRKLEMQLNRIKAGLPLEDETISEVGEDEAMELARKFYTFIKRSYSIKGNEILIKKKIQSYLKQSGYRQIVADDAIIFTRGRKIISFSPKDWLSLVEVNVLAGSEILTVELQYGVDLRGQIVMPWERAFWRKELSNFETALSSDGLRHEYRFNQRANQLAFWLNLGLALGFIHIIVVLIVGIILSIAYIVEERLPDIWGIVGLIVIVGIVVAILVIFTRLKRRAKTLW